MNKAGRVENYIKRQIRISIANKEKLNNLNDVSEVKINEAYESKKLYNFTIRMDKMKDGKTYFAFIDNDTGYYYNSAII